MTKARCIVQSAIDRGLEIREVSGRSSQWVLEGVNLRETGKGELVLSGVTGHGGIVHSVEDLLAFLDDPEAWHRRLPWSSPTTAT